MQLNRKPDHRVYTHEGAPASANVSTFDQLRRSVLSCFLWEKEFYEDGIEIAERIEVLARKCEPYNVAMLAVEAREQFHLRHVPLLLLNALAATGAGIPLLVSNTIARVIQRPDEMTEFLAIYWRNGRKPLSAQMKKGLRAAFAKFDAYQLAKYNRDGAVKLRDVMFLVHPHPTTIDQSNAWSKLADKRLESPDTWEVSLSAGADKRETFTRLIQEGKLGYMALLRNLRNMQQSGVDKRLVTQAILERKGADRVLPFRFVAAARAVPEYEPTLDKAMCAEIKRSQPMVGETIVLVDVSASMDAAISMRGDLSRMDAAATLASIFPGKMRVFSFSTDVVEVPARRGMAGIDAIKNSQHHGGTRLGRAIEYVNSLPHDRLVVITDEQSQDRVQDPRASKAYMINVASNKNGVSYGPKWVHLDGFSESVLSFMRELEGMTYTRY